MNNIPNPETDQGALYLPFKRSRLIGRSFGLAEHGSTGSVELDTRYAVPRRPRTLSVRPRVQPKGNPAPPPPPNPGVKGTRQLSRERPLLALFWLAKGEVTWRLLKERWSTLSHQYDRFGQENGELRQEFSSISGVFYHIVSDKLFIKAPGILNFLSSIAGFFLETHLTKLFSCCQMYMVLSLSTLLERKDKETINLTVDSWWRMEWVK